MASVDLVFAGEPLSQPANLVFGDDGSSPIKDAVITGELGLPQLVFSSTIYLGYTVSATLLMPALGFSSEVIYDSATARPLVAQAAVRWQGAQPQPEVARARWADGVRMPARAAVRFQVAKPLQVARRFFWQEGNRQQRQWLRSRFQDAVPVASTVRDLFQNGMRAPNVNRQRFEDGRPVRRSVAQRFQDGVRTPNVQHARYQDARPLVTAIASRNANGLPLTRGWLTRYQEAIPPRPGVTNLHPTEPPVDPCYIPGANLVFDALWSADTNLVFVCERHGPGPEPGETVVIPIRRVYVVENHITLHRVDTGAAIEADAFSMSLDVDSWTWTWSASLPAAALSLIEPGSDGDPVDIETMVNGVAFRLCAESYSRERSFGKARIRVQGRGRGAILDAPYAPTLNHFSAGTLTAQQLAALALTINGVGIGWDVAWGLEDWSVPGGTWSIQGSYIAAVQDIVRAAGGYVQPHRTAATLRVLPRYPATPWTWNALTPDFELPSAVASVESIDWRSLPAYDRVFVGGTTAAGVLGQVTRAGTAGGSVAPMVTHPLITNAIAARQRGLAELSNTGRQALVTLRMPVLAETGIIHPGALVRYVDGGTTRLGLVRSTSVSWDRPVLRQTIGLETHVD